MTIIILFVGLVIGYAVGIRNKEDMIKNEIKLRKEYELTVRKLLNTFGLKND